MDPLGPGQGLDIAGLREQRDRRDCLACQHDFKVFAQGKAGTLDGTGGVVRAKLRALHKALHRILHGMQQQGRRRHTHHLQRTAGLV